MDFTADWVEKKQNQQIEHCDSKAKLRVFTVGLDVIVKNHSAGCQWLPGNGDTSY